MKVIYNFKPLRLFRIIGIMLFGYAFVITSKEQTCPILLNHERIHYLQMKRDGYLNFYLIYLYEYFVLRFKGCKHWEAYFLISYEVEAYENELNLEYTI